MPANGPAAAAKPTRQLALLVKVQLLAMLAGFGLLRKGRTARDTRRAVLVVAGALLLAAVFAVYLGATGFVLAAVGAADVVPALAVLVGSLAGVAFTFLKANGVLFGFRDYDMTMALPVPTRVVVLSRVLSLFGMGFVWAALTMVPLYVAYFAAAGVTVPALLAAVVSVVLAPLLPSSVAVLAAFLITVVASRFRHARAVFVGIVFVGIILVFFGSMGLSFSSASMANEMLLEDLAGVVGQLREALVGTYPPAAWLRAAVVEGSVFGFVLFGAVSLAAPALLVELLSRGFMAVNAALAARSTSGGFNVAQLSDRARSPLAALVRKEFSCVLGDSTYALNGLMGDALMVVAAVALSVAGMRPALEALTVNGQAMDPGFVDLAFRLAGVEVPWVASFFAVVAPTAACALSMEGRANWVMATAPVSARTVLGAKLLANVLHVGAASAVSALILLVGGQVAPLVALSCALMPTGLAVLVGGIGLAVDASRPNYGWSTSAEVVKRGAPVTVSVLVGLALVFVGGAANVALAIFVSQLAAEIVPLVFPLAAAAIGFAVFWRVSARQLYV